MEFSSEPIFYRPELWGGECLPQAKGVPPTPKKERYPDPPTDFLKVFTPHAPLLALRGECHLRTKERVPPKTRNEKSRRENSQKRVVPNNRSYARKQRRVLPVDPPAPDTSDRLKNPPEKRSRAASSHRSPPQKRNCLITGKIQSFYRVCTLSDPPSLR